MAGHDDERYRGREGKEVNYWWVVNVIWRLCRSAFLKHVAASLINERNVTLQSLCQLGPLRSQRFGSGQCKVLWNN